MLQRTAIPFLLIVLLMACSGASGPTGAGPVGGNNSQFANAAAPGTEEVMLGPGAADPGGISVTMECEWKCEPSTNGEGSQLAFKGKLGIKPGDRTLRIYEYLIEEHLSRFQDIQSDTEGNFSFVLGGSESRNVRVLLLKAPVGSMQLNKVLPCPDGSCTVDEAGNPYTGAKGACFDAVDSTDLVCDMPLNFPRFNLGKIKIPNS